MIAAGLISVVFGAVLLAAAFEALRQEERFAATIEALSGSGFLLGGLKLVLP